MALKGNKVHMKNQPLSHAEIDDLFEANPMWDADEAKRSATAHFTFKNFQIAFAVMTEIALLAEKHDHHPEWSNVYGRLSITMTSHDIKGLSVKDANMIPLITATAERHQK